METNLNEVLFEFEDYCTNDIVSGKARSYRLAIKYLCDFLNITYLDNNALEKIKNTSMVLQDINSHTYLECLKFLTKRGQSSYLLKGWINASIIHFFAFINQ